MKSRAVILALSLSICSLLNGQVRDELIWSSSLMNDTEEDYRKNYKRIASAGYQLDLEALSVGNVKVLFTDLAGLVQSIPGGSDGLYFNYINQSGQSDDVFIDRNEVRAQLTDQFDEYLEEKIKKKKFRGSSAKYRKEQEKDFQMILKGKRKGVSWKGYTWPIEIGRASNLNPKKPYNITFVCKKVPYAKLEFDSLYSDLTTTLPQLNNENCQPFDRYTYFRKYFGISYAGFPYRPYRPRAGIPRKKNFRIYFNKASSSYNRREINQIIKYLNDSNLVIETAKVLAFASVEGDSAVNMRLQQQRATVLMQTLEKANNDSIEISMETREDWSQFNSQLRGSKYQGKYSKKEWKEKFKSRSTQREFEKYFKEQRRAELFLTLTQRLTDDEKVAVALGDFQRYARRYQPNARPEVRIRQVRRIFSIKKYLEIQAARGVADEDVVCGLFPPGTNEYHIFQFYETAKVIRKGQQPVCNNLAEIIVAAHASVLDMMVKYGSKRLYLQQALDIQSFAYEMVGKEKIKADILCQLIYPDEPAYYSLILNQLYFQDHQGFDYSQDLPCLGSYYQGSISNQNRFFASSKSTNAAEEPNRRYYYLLKKIVLEDDENIKKLVDRSDHITQFDIFEFLYYNVTHWDVFENRFFDPEVTPEIMTRQLDRLLGMDGVICPNQVNSIALAFHLKVMHYGLVNDKADKLTNEALDFVSHYYQGFSDKMSDRLALMVAKQIMATSKLYYQNEPAKEAFDVLRLKDWKEPLKGEALNYYLNLVNLVAQDRDQRMQILERKYPNKVWDSFFTGKYSIPKDRPYK